MWNALSEKASEGLSRHLLQATYQDKLLVSWVLFKFKNILYYPYGASSHENREVMGSHAMMWAALEFGKKLGCQKFDLWGAAAPNYSKSDPWAGFTRFKEGFGGTWVAFVGSYDLPISPSWYKIYGVADKLRGVASKIGITI
jgi:lipid II:glycine glycyltransferase (peptidoglycan interpeptide bridge formation enzyme)